MTKRAKCDCIRHSSVHDVMSVTFRILVYANWSKTKRHNNSKARFSTHNEAYRVVTIVTWSYLCLCALYLISQYTKKQLTKQNLDKLSRAVSIIQLSPSSSLRRLCQRQQYTHRVAYDAYCVSSTGSQCVEYAICNVCTIIDVWVYGFWSVSKNCRRYVQFTA